MSCGVLARVSCRGAATVLAAAALVAALLSVPVSAQGADVAALGGNTVTAAGDSVDRLHGFTADHSVYRNTAVKSDTVSNDIGRLVLTSGSVTVGEGSRAEYGVKLSKQPSGPVTVTVSALAGGDLVVSSAAIGSVSVTGAVLALTFDTGDWDTYQSVTVHAHQDDDVLDDTETLAHSATGGGYSATGDVAVIVTDDDSSTVEVAVIVTDDDTAPPPSPQFGIFADTDTDNVHMSAIETMFDSGITVGCGGDPPRFCPEMPVTRAQMASLLARSLDLGDAPQPAGFVDVDPRSTHAAAIDALHYAGITAGCGTHPLRFCPDLPVTRAQMAGFLYRALDFADAPQSAGFVDVDPQSPHAAAIDALYHSGVTKGCGSDPLRYCPHQYLTRAQMASLLRRALDLGTTA